jgi:hypothetical protein
VTRAEVADRWTALAEGNASLAEVHAWADKHVRESGHEPLAEHGLQTLHGLTGRTNPGSSEEIVRRLTEWQAECAAYDRDPGAWTRERMSRAMRGLGLA